MTFEYPQLLWLLAGIPVLGLVLFFAGKRSRRTVSSLVGGGRGEYLLSVLIIKSFVVSVLFTVAVASLILALAEPRWGEVSVEDERRGLDLVFLMDVSNSMIAEDIPPSRLVRTREIARSLADRLGGAYKAVVAFKGAATVLVPMTEDPVAFDLAVGNLSGALITSAGTDVGRGIDAAIDAFPSGSPRHQAIVLFSDGDSLSNIGRETLDRLRASGIPIFAVASATANGATIPRADGGVLRDAEGRPVIARLDLAALQELVELSGGRLYRITDPGVAQQVADDLQRLSGGAADVIFRETSVNRYHLFVLAAVVSVMAIAAIQHTRWRNVV